MASNLHSSLVSQILNLQRDRDFNLASVERLEEALGQAHAQNQELQAEFRRKERERQLQQREIQSTGESTLLALEELCRERDAARAAAEELRLRRESMQRRLKNQQDEAAMAVRLLNEERAKWEAEKRDLELKAQIARAKLDTVLQEVAEHEAEQHDEAERQVRHDSVVDQADDDYDVPTPRALEQEDRRASVVTIEYRRSSVAHGLSLADELAEEPVEEEDADLYLRPQSSFDPSISPSLDVSARTSIDFAEEEAPVRRARAVRLSQTLSSDLVSTVINTTPPRHSLSLSDSSSTPRNGSPRKSREEQVELRELIDTSSLLPKLEEVASEEQETEEPEEVQIFDHSLMTDSYKPPTPADMHMVDYMSSAVSTSNSPIKKQTQDDLHELLAVPASDNAANQRRKRTVPTTPRLGEELSHITSEQPQMSSAATQTDFDASTTVVQYMHFESPRSSSDFANAATQTTISSFIDMASQGTQTDEAELEVNKTTAGQGMQKMLSRPRSIDDLSVSSTIKDSRQQNSSSNARPTPVRAVTRRGRHSRASFLPPAPVPEADNEDLSPPQSKSASDKLSPNPATRPYPARVSSLFSNSVERRMRHYSSKDSLASVASSNLASPPYAIPVRRSSRTASQQFSPSVIYDIATPTRRPDSSPRKRLQVRKSPAKPVVRRSRNGPILSRPASQDFTHSRPSSRAASRPETPRRRTLLNQQRPALEEYSYEIDHDSITSEIPSEVEQETNVVDAIAATMVGEWMWKYVKGRSDDFMQDNSKAIRHKRWVWLSPHDRAILWSDKQPTSSAALMGRSGRKMIIQSVVDVKDNTPLPKGAKPGDICDRSIIVLTPERAIKFSATTEKRHYLWLTALTFLSKQNSSHDSINLDIPLMKRSVDEQKDEKNSTSSDQSRQATIAAAIGRSSQGSGIATQTRFPFPFDNRTFSNTTSAMASPARPARTQRSSIAPEDPTTAAPTSKTFAFSSAQNNAFVWTSAPSDTPVDDADWIDCALPPTVPRLPSGASSLHKKPSNISLRPSSTRAKSSIEVSSRTTTMTETSRPFIAPRANTTTSIRSGFSSHNYNHNVTKAKIPGPLAMSHLAWPATPPRSSSSSGDLDADDDVEGEDMGASAVNADFFDVDPSFPAAPQMLRSHKGLGHPVLDRALADDENVFVGRPLRSHPVRERNMSVTSIDSVAPPSIETSRAGGGRKGGRVGRLLWR